MKKTVSIAFIISAIAFVMALGLSICVGSIPISIKEITQFLTRDSNLSEAKYQILLNVRLPRIMLAIFVGAALSVSGALLQSVMQNPLADPGIIGVSSGASVAIMIILLVIPAYAPLLPIIAFIGGICATILIYLLAWKNGINTLSLLLSGIAVNAMLGGISSLISVMNSEKIQTVILWLNGTLAGRSWKDVKIVAIYTVISLIISFFCIRDANVLLLGDQKAKNLGINVYKARIFLSLVAAFLAGISTSAVGVIGFIGLVVPHITRMIVGSDYKFLIPFSMLNGAVFLLFTDTIARVIAAPVEMPVGTIMSIIGGPFFLYLLRKRTK